MALHWYSIVIDCTNHRAQAQWWAEALGYTVVFESDDEAVVMPQWVATEGDVNTLEEWRIQPQGLVFVPVSDEKRRKNRIHIDLAPHTTQDRDAEIRRLMAMGARRADTGQGSNATWTLLSDPEGNEFGILSARSR